jgi:hypothetical protein
MTIQDLGSLGDMIGGVAVVASLIYLAIQIRQNTKQVSRNIESADRIREMFILHPDIADLYLSGMKNYDSLRGRERFRFDMLMRTTLTAFQGAYLRQMSTGTDPLGFEGAGRLIDSILKSPGARAWLERGKFDWRPEFEEFLDERLAKLTTDAAEPTKK